MPFQFVRSPQRLPENFSQWKKPIVIVLRDHKGIRRAKSLQTSSTEPHGKDFGEQHRNASNSLKNYAEINDEMDLTLLENLDWLVNFPVSRLFHRVLDEEDAMAPPRCNTVTRQCSVKSGGTDGGHWPQYRERPSATTDSAFVQRSGLRVRSLPKPKGPKAVRRTRVLRKPTMTYPQLIEKCLRERGGLTVHGIYEWMSERYPFFDSKDDGWKNAVRHNLSIHSQFRKGEAKGRSHVWYLDDCLVTAPLPPPPDVPETRGNFEHTASWGFEAGSMYWQGDELPADVFSHGVSAHFQPENTTPTACNTTARADFTSESSPAVLSEVEIETTLPAADNRLVKTEVEAAFLAHSDGNRPAFSQASASGEEFAFPHQPRSELEQQSYWFPGAVSDLSQYADHSCVSGNQLLTPSRREYEQLSEFGSEQTSNYKLLEEWTNLSMNGDALF